MAQPTELSATTYRLPTGKQLFTFRVSYTQDASLIVIADDRAAALEEIETQIENGDLDYIKSAENPGAWTKTLSSVNIR